MNEKELIEAMTDPESYPHTTGKIEVKETHISWVFLTGHFVYKVKKPIKFGGILDYSTLTNRKNMCEKELVINRRFSPEIYLEVVDIVRGGDGKLRVGYGTGNVVEHAVKMKQINQRNMLSEMLKRGEATSTTIKGIVAFMVGFYNRSHVPMELATRYAELKKKYMNVTFDTVNRLGKNNDAARKKFNGFLKDKREVFMARTAEGFVRDLHGDAHSGNIFMDNGEVFLFDAIEFNDELRVQDIAYEIAALAMDLEFHNYPNLSKLYMDEYMRISGDAGAKKLFPMYMFYWAYVRGEVELEKSQKAGNRESAMTAEKYFKLSDKYLMMI